MPPATFTCAICGEQVSKPKSYALPNGGGRACRIHEEAQAGHEQMIAADEQKKLKEQENFQKTKDRWKNRHAPVSTGPTCFCCKVEGFHQQDFFMRKLLAMRIKERQAATTTEPMNFFEMMGHVEGVSPDKPCLWIVKMEEERLIMQLDYHSRFTVRMMGLAMLCNECRQKLGLSDTIPDLNIDQLNVVSAVMETSGLKQELDQMADEFIKEQNNG
jgi:hypothetical protein